MPEGAADDIAAAARSIKVDLRKLRHEAEIVGYPILPRVHQLSEAGRYLHWGATTQDIMDTANVLQLRAALQIVARDLRELHEILAMMARKHRDTAMAGGHTSNTWAMSWTRAADRMPYAVMAI